MTSEVTKIRRVSWDDPEAEDCKSVRRRVFIEEQDVPESEEWDTEDQSSSHWLASLPNGEPIGTARMTVNGKIGRVAVLKTARGLGIGAQLMQAALSYALDNGVNKLSLDAQVHAIEFYERLGFQAEGPEFLDAGIKHRKMTRTLNP